MWTQLSDEKTQVCKVPGGMVIKHEHSDGSSQVFVPCSEVDADAWIDAND